jgi:hypothetical protein
MPGFNPTKAISKVCLFAIHSSLRSAKVINN